MSQPQKGKGKGKGKAHAAPITDPRFSTLHTDPRFLKPRREQAKVVLDERFAHLLTDAGEEQRVKVDKFGRKKGKKDEQKELRRFYKLDDDKEQHEEEEDREASPPAFIDYARGEGQLQDSSSSDDDDDDDDDDSDSDDSSDHEPVTLGRSDVLARERRKAAAHPHDSDDSIDLDEQEESDSDDDDGADESAEVSRQLLEAGSEVAALDPSALATLDAQAEAAVRSEKKAAKAATAHTGDDTCRLAVVNMDWDHLRARDLYKVFASLVSDSALGSNAASGSAGTARRRRGDDAGSLPVVPVKGSVLHVRVYPSEFGRKRMEKEDIFGPPRDIFGAKGGAEEGAGRKRRNKKKKRRDEDGLTEESSSEEEGIVQVDDGEEFNEEALRKYQLERLRYYYAIATFSSASAARHVYNTIDGTEMERTANVFDLSFVPDGMEFPAGPGEGKNAVEGGWRDEASGDDELSGVKYKAVDWRTDALRHSKVKLTWDADDPERAKVTRALYAEPDASAKKGKKGKKGGPSAAELRDDDYRAYIASASEDEGEDDDGGGRLRALLGDGGSSGGVFGRKSDEQGDMQITFLPGLSEAAARKAAGTKAPNKEDETTLEKYLRKQREKKGRRREDPTETQADEKPAEEDAEQHGFDDPFFQSAAGDDDFERALQAEMRGGPTRGAASERTHRETDAKSSKRDTEELRLLLDEPDAEARGGHFDMKAVLRAEKREGSRKLKHLDKIAARKARARGAADAADGDGMAGNDEAQRNFELDTADPRFGRLLEDHAYALDPSHPSFVDTKAMRKLVAARRKRAGGAGAPEQDQGRGADVGGKGEGGEDEELRRLVKRVKRQATDRGEVGGRGHTGAGAGPKPKKVKHT